MKKDTAYCRYPEYISESKVLHPQERMLKRVQQEIKTGFTLIELLVVVLIIGILSAVALPQYQKAVDKTRYATVMSMTKSLKDAEEIYYLANGTYTPSRSDLDIDSFCPQRSAGENDIFCNKDRYDLLTNSTDLAVGGFPTDDAGIAVNAFVMWLDYSAQPGVRECYALQGNTRAADVCRTAGGVKTGSRSLAWIGSCDVYTLP